MKVTVVDYTGYSHPTPAIRAAALLIFAKSTRLTMKPGLLDEIMTWAQVRLIDELEYIANTIPASWEFVDYTFLIEDVTRAFTHQFVRSRHWSFAQQTMRVLDVSEGPGWTYGTGPSIDQDNLLREYDTVMDRISEGYKCLVKNGAKPEDARGILPTNIHTNILAKCNMRGLVELVRKRSSPRVQGEYREVLEAMKTETMRVHPWLHLFLDRTFERAARDLQDCITLSVSDTTARTNMFKLLDQMRAQS